MNNKHIHNKDHDYFKVIDTEDKAYLFGFICADGHISTKKSNKYVQIELQARDIEILRYFKKYTKYSGKIGDSKHYTPNNKNKQSKYKYIKIYGEIFTNHLINKGLDNQKSYTLKFPYRHIPKNLIHHFIRGYFDGDGGISVTKSKNQNKYTFMIISNSDFSEYLLRFFKRKLNISSFMVKYKKTKQNTYTCDIRLYGYKEIKKLMDFMYKDATIFLKRKKKNFDKIIKQRIKYEQYLLSQRKLNLTQVKEIRKRLSKGKETHRHIAKDYNISHGIINSIANNKCYKEYK
jgi:hypothetical protein